MFVVCVAQAKSIGDAVSDFVGKQDVKLNIPLFELQLGDSISVPGHSYLRVYPNNDLKTYSRVESFRLGLNLSVPILESSLYVPMKSESGVMGEFIRQFQTQKEALNVIKNKPYIVDAGNKFFSERVPFTALGARKLSSKDYFRFQIRTALRLQAGLLKSLGLMQGSLGAEYLLYGDFQFEIYRKTNGRILVRATSLKKRGRSLGAQWGRPDTYVLRLFQMEWLDELATSLLPKKIFEIQISDKAIGDLFAVEYEFNLEDQDAQIAYEQMVNPRSWKMVDIYKVLNPANPSTKAMETTLAVTISTAEKISLMDSNLPSGSARVRRLIKSHTEFIEKKSGAKINFRLINIENKFNYLEQDIRLVLDPMSQEYRHFKLSTAAILDRDQSWLAFSNEYESKKESNILFDLDEKMKISEFRELSFHYERQDKKLNFHEKKDALGMIYLMVPGIYHKYAPFDALLKQYIKSRSFIRLDMVIDKRAFLFMTGLSSIEVSQTLKQFIQLVFSDQANRYYEYGNLQMFRDAPGIDEQSCGTAKSRMACLQGAYKKDLDFILQSSLQILALAKEPDQYERVWQLYVKLQNNRLYKKIGQGLFMRLVEVAGWKRKIPLERLATFKLTLVGTLGGENQIVFGKFNRPTYLPELLKIRDRILQREFDPIYFD